MSHGTRTTAVLVGLILGLAPSGLAHASTIGNPPVQGTYTYNISLPNGASFTLTRLGSLGDPHGTTLSTSFNGSPMDGYVQVGGQTGTGDDTTWTELQFQYEKPDSPGSNTADSILSYTFTESDSFWATHTGETLFPDDTVTTYGGLLYLNLNMDGSFVDPGDIGADIKGGTVHQGAWFDTYTPAGPVASDPPCLGCSISITFTPAASVIPEPSTMTLLGTGMVAIAGVYRRRRLW